MFVSVLEEDKGGQTDTATLKARARPKPWMALHDKEFVNIIQSCWRLSQKKKALTAPVAKPWLMDTIKDNMAVEVVFVCSKITKISMIKSMDMEPNKDPLSALPSYANRRKGDGASGHLRLKRVPLTLPRPDASPAPLTPRPPPPTSETKLNEKGASLLNLLNDPSVPFATPVKEPPSGSQAPVSDKQLYPAASPSNVKVSAPPPVTKPWSRPRLCHPVPNTSMPVTQMSDSTVTNTVKVSAPPPYLTPTVKILAPPPYVTPTVKHSEPPPYVSPTPPSSTDIIPIRNTEFFSPPEECDSFNPIIISTESLAPVAETSRPQIKCRPTSALLAARPFHNPPPPPLQIAPSLPPPQMTPPQMTPGVPPPSMYSNPMIIHDDKGVPNISLPLLSSNNLFFNNGVLTHNGMSPFDLFTNKLKENNVFIVKQHIPNQDVDELVRFILTIREKRVAHNQFNAAHEFLVEVSGYLGNRILISTQDTLSNLVEVALWSNDFQQELIKSLNKPTFLETMRGISLSARPQVTACVARFISTLQNSGIWDRSVNDAEPNSSIMG